MNKHRGEERIELCGNVYTLRMTFNALVELEDATATTGIKILEEMAKGSVSAKAMAAVIWAGYRGAMTPAERLRSLTLESIGEMVLEHGMPSLLMPVFRFLSRAYSTQEQIEETQARLGKEDSEVRNTAT